GANVQGALRCGRFFLVFGLLVKINVGLVVVVFQKIRSLVQTHAAGRAGRVHVPESGNVFGLFACFIGHKKFLLKTAVESNVFLGGAHPAVSGSRDVYFSGDGLGSGFGSIGRKSAASGVAVAVGAGVGTGDNNRPLFVINFPSREKTSSTRYRLPLRAKPSFA